MLRNYIYNSTGDGYAVIQQDELGHYVNLIHPRGGMADGTKVARGIIVRHPHFNFIWVLYTDDSWIAYPDNPEEPSDRVVFFKEIDGVKVGQRVKELAVAGREFDFDNDDIYDYAGQGRPTVKVTHAPSTSFLIEEDD